MAHESPRIIYPDAKVRYVQNLRWLLDHKHDVASLAIQLPESFTGDWAAEYGDADCLLVATLVLENTTPVVFLARFNSLSICKQFVKQRKAWRDFQVSVK